ncbi:MAG: DNA-protecting protein DprA [Parachlamydiaceae bacterium]|nr:DNA-protecting protein DprA [Parachlamydiaceae bacterium]
MNSVMELEHPLKGKISLYQLEETEALVILMSMVSLGPIKIRLLATHFGSAIEALLAPSEYVLPFVGSKAAALWGKWPTENSWKNNLLLAAKHQAEIIPFTSSQYPKRLLEIPDAPVLLYMQGTLLPADRRSIAIVGTRQLSIYGQEMAHRFAQDLAALGFTIVSGLARGVDTAAHIGALEKGRTIGVIGSGLADIYPAENRKLAERMVTQGAVISEFPMATPPDRQNFPQRNRIVSGMTLGTLLIEAPVKSGAMITMEKGEAQGRPLFAIPGRIDSENFRGNHSLIKQNRAILVESAYEIASYYESLFGKMSPLPSQELTKTLTIPLDKEESLLLESLPNQELSVEQIFLLTKIPISALNVLLMGLVIKGCLKEFPGKVYMKTR